VTLELYEPIHPGVTADNTAYTSDNTELTADGGPLVGALDFTDAEVIAATAPVFGGGGLPWMPPLEPIEGVGFGILPELKGEAHGVIIAAGIGAAMLRNPAGEAVGAVGARGRSEGQLRVQVAASGARMAKGAGAAGLDLGAIGAGVIGARGNGLAAIGNLEAIAAGRQDDDAAAIAWLLAA
jgi:hypothetical protein